jgi:hypothetical protein
MKLPDTSWIETVEGRYVIRSFQNDFSSRTFKEMSSGVQFPTAFMRIVTRNFDFVESSFGEIPSFSGLLVSTLEDVVQHCSFIWSPAVVVWLACCTLFCFESKMNRWRVGMGIRPLLDKPNNLGLHIHWVSRKYKATACSEFVSRYRFLPRVLSSIQFYIQNLHNELCGEFNFYLCWSSIYST